MWEFLVIHEGAGVTSIRVNGLNASALERVSFAPLAQLVRRQGGYVIAEDEWAAAAVARPPTGWRGAAAVAPRSPVGRSAESRDQAVGRFVGVYSLPIILVALASWAYASPRFFVEAFGLVATAPATVSDLDDVVRSVALTVASIGLVVAWAISGLRRRRALRESFIGTPTA